MSSQRNLNEFDLYRDFRDIYEGWRSHDGSIGSATGQPTSAAHLEQSTRQREIVDLTSEATNNNTSRHIHDPTQHPASHGSASRGPRFANDIIDVDAYRPSMAASRRNRIDNDGFEIVGQRQVSPPFPEPHRAPPTRSTATSSGFDQLSMAQRSTFGNMIQQFARNMPFSIGGFLPPSLDYRSVPFNNFGAPDIFIPEPEPVPAPRYRSPPSAPPGFTYTPSEDEAYVCPNCDEELRTGDSDLERQVWVIKACGHAYCGQCAQNRFTTKHRKLKQPSKTKPFKQCVIEDCPARTTGVKSMTQIFI